MLFWLFLFSNKWNFFLNNITGKLNINVINENIKSIEELEYENISRVDNIIENINNNDNIKNINMNNNELISKIINKNVFVINEESELDNLSIGNLNDENWINDISLD